MLKNLFGQKLDEVTIKRIKTFEPLGGYYLAFSGGKDSIVLHNLTVRAGVRFESWYNNTTCDPPELIRFIKKHYPQVNWNNPEMSIFTAIVKHGFPLRHRRWCCRIYKESGGRNRTVLVGNRGEESYKRKQRGMINNCTPQGKVLISPLIDWTSQEIWGYIREKKLPYCDLYDQGFDRLGCTICPFERNVERAKKRWPRYFKLLEKSFAKLYLKSRACQEHWDNSHQMLSWWLKRDAKYPKSEPIPEQRELFDI